MSEQASILLNTTPDLDEVSVAGDSVKSYLNEIGRTSLLKAEDEVLICRRIEAGIFAGRILDLQSCLCKKPDELSAEDKTLVVKYKSVSDGLEFIKADGQSAKSHMIHANLRLVVSIAKRYAGRGLDLQDLIQEGNIGLIHAIDKFDYRQGNKFSTYGSWWIKQSLSRAMAEKSRTIKIPSNIVTEVNKLIRVSTLFFQDNGRDATDQELAEILAMTVDKARLLKDLNKRPVPLDRSIVADGQVTIGDMIEDKAALLPEASTLSDMTHADISKAIDQLDPRQAFVIRRRYGINTSEQQTLDQVGRDLGLTRERVRQIQRLAEDKLRQKLINLGITSSSAD